MAQLPNLPGFIRDSSGRLSVNRQDPKFNYGQDDEGVDQFASEQDILGQAYERYYERTNLPRGQLGGGNYIDRTFTQNEAGDDIPTYSLRYTPPAPPAPVRPPVPPSTGQPPPGPPEVPRQPPQTTLPYTPSPTPLPGAQPAPPPSDGLGFAVMRYYRRPKAGGGYDYYTSGNSIDRPSGAGWESSNSPWPGEPTPPRGDPNELKLQPAPQPAPKGPATPVPSWVTPPPPGSGTLQALETLTNPVTGETYTAPTSGYTVNIPAPQPAPLPDFKEQQGQQQAQQYPNIPPEFFSSPEYRNVPNIGGQALTPTKYFGTYGNTTGTDMDAAFDQFLARTGTNYTGPVADISERSFEALPTPQPAPQPAPAPPSAPPSAPPRPTPAPPSEMEQKVVGETAAQAGIGTVPPVLDPQTQLTYIPKQFEYGEAYKDVQDFVNLEGNVVTASTTGLEVPAPPRTNAQTYSAYVQEGTPEYVAAQGQPSSESLIGDIQGAVSQESIAQAAVGELDEKATVKYQMDQLFDSFEEGKPPPAWAAPAVRSVGSMMAQRGLGKSSMAAAAITQAMMESGIQIAAQDANKYATIQLNNLNNQQKTSLQNAMTFAAMDKANLDARMQAAVNNSRVFLQMDTANLTNQQQLKTIDLQQQYQKMFNDNAQENAARQFNAKSQMQVDQFFTELDTQVANANVSRMAAMDQFNADQVNAADRYYAKLNDAREKLNVQLDAQISQANTNWRRQINTANTAEQNRVNQQNALNLLEIQQSAMDKIWQRYRDEAQWALTVSENNAQRAHTAALFAQSNEFNAAQYEKESKDFMYTAMGNTVLKGIFHLL